MGCTGFHIGELRREIVGFEQPPDANASRFGPLALFADRTANITRRALRSHAAMNCAAENWVDQLAQMLLSTWAKGYGEIKWNDVCSGSVAK